MSFCHCSGCSDSRLPPAYEPVCDHLFCVTSAGYAGGCDTRSKRHPIWCCCAHGRIPLWLAPIVMRIEQIYLGRQPHAPYVLFTAQDLARLNIAIGDCVLAPVL